MEKMKRKINNRSQTKDNDSIVSNRSQTKDNDSIVSNRSQTKDNDSIVSNRSQTKDNDSIVSNRSQTKDNDSIVSNRSQTKENDSIATDMPLTKDSDSNTIRGNWGHKVEFVLSVVGFTVGFGNIWRFPYLCYRNGGGAFLVAYLIMLFLVGVPLYFMELAIGQYASLGAVAIWKLAPIFKGIGITTVVTVCMVALYYNALLAYVLFYLFSSMTHELPWATCGHAWNTENCIVREARPKNLNSSFNSSYSMFNKSDAVYLPMGLNHTLLVNQTMLSRPQSPAAEFFDRYVLDISSGIDDFGGIRWPLFLCFLLAWIIVYACVAKGIEFSGKVVYFTATFPYLVLVALFIRGITLPGAFEGLKYYVSPQWKYVLSPRVWGEAASQIFYSLGPAWGLLIIYGSYNKFHNKCNWDAFIASSICSGTSLLAGVVIFSVLGFMSHELNVPISEVMTSGPGLVFVAYPEALVRMPAAPFWSTIFFTMLFTLGLDTSFPQVELLMVLLEDANPKFGKRKWLVSLCICICFFVGGIPCTFQGGMYLVNLLDWYAATFAFTAIGILENLVLIYVYGYKNLEKDIELMIGQKPNLFYKICWYFVTPTITLFIFMFSVVTHTPVTYGEVEYPRWAVAFGLTIGIVPILITPAYMVYYTASYFSTTQEFIEAVRCPWKKETLSKLFSPSPDWGPMMPQHRLEAGLGIKDEEQICLSDEEIKLTTLNKKQGP